MRGIACCMGSRANEGGGSSSSGKATLSGPRSRGRLAWLCCQPYRWRLDLNIKVTKAAKATRVLLGLQRWRLVLLLLLGLQWWCLLLLLGLQRWLLLLLLLLLLNLWWCLLLLLKLWCRWRHLLLLLNRLGRWLSHRR